jgi:hypothetical protein
MTPDIFEKPGSPENIGALNLGVQAGSAATVAVDPNSTIVTLDSTANPIALNLPPAAQDAGRTLFVVATTYVSLITITPAGADTIGGSANKTLGAVGKFAVITAKGSDWKIVMAN